jgi:sugar phosphate isomerase/epimerase
MIGSAAFRTFALPAAVALAGAALAGDAAPSPAPAPVGTEVKGGDIFAKDNLLAWCIVPFDARNRTPGQRVEMLLGLGIRRMAYDWRGHHVPTWDEEMELYKKHGIELVGFWGYNDNALALMKRHGIKTQFWITMGGGNVEAAANHVEQVARKANEAGCTVALYNHGGWGGEPENQIAVIERLRARGIQNVGICYNLHHAHHRMKDFAEVLGKMTPYLWCLNLNGMKPGTKVLPFGQGEDDAEVLRTVRKSGWRGPIGILGHRGDVDAELALRQNLDGLKAMLRKIGETEALKTYP